MMTVIRRELTDVLGRIKTTGSIETTADKEFTGIANQNGKLYVYSKRNKMYTYEQLDTSDAFDKDWNYKLQYPTVLHKMTKLFDADTIRVEATDNNGIDEASTDGGIKIVNGYNSPLEFITPAFKNEEEMTFITEKPEEAPKQEVEKPKKKVVIKKKVKATAKRKITVKAKAKPQPKAEKLSEEQIVTKTIDEITDMLVQYAMEHVPNHEELTAYATEVLATYNVR